MSMHVSLSLSQKVKNNEKRHLLFQLRYTSLYGNVCRTLITLIKVYFRRNVTVVDVQYDPPFHPWVLNIRERNTCNCVPLATHLSSHSATSVAQTLQNGDSESCNEADPEQQKDEFCVVPRKRLSFLSVFAVKAVLSEVQKLQLLQEFLLFELLKGGVDGIEVRRI